jgi:hypothetical protein
MMEVSVPVSGVSPELTLDAVPVLYIGTSGPAAVQVTSGAQVDFIPTPTAATTPHIEVESWEWTPADASQPAETETCNPGETPCRVPVFEDGTMRVTARVDGQNREATASVGLTEPIVTCEPTIVERGDPITCTLSPADAVNDLVKWRFEDDLGGVPVEWSVREATWTGPAVIGGTVTAILSGDGPHPQDSYTVSPRDWSDISAAVITPSWTRWGPEDQITAFVPKPEAVHDLGHVDYDRSDPDENTIAFPSSGPNVSYAYFSAVPYTVTAYVHVHPELAENSDFWAAQYVYESPGKCMQEDVVPFIDKIVEHEGVRGTPEYATSHIGLFEAKLIALGSQALEEIVSQSYNELLDDAHLAFVPLFLAADAESIRADTEFFPEYCTFNYNY